MAPYALPEKMVDLAELPSFIKTRLSSARRYLKAKTVVIGEGWREKRRFAVNVPQVSPADIYWGAPPASTEVREAPVARIWLPRRTKVVRDSRVGYRVMDAAGNEIITVRRGVGVAGLLAVAGASAALGIMGWALADKDNSGHPGARQASIEKWRFGRLEHLGLSALKKLDRNYESDVVHARQDKARDNKTLRHLHIYGDNILYHLKKVERAEQSASQENDDTSMPANETAGQAIVIRSGDGYTNAIARAYPGHSASEYYRAHLALLRRFGPNYIQGVGKYERPGGGLGLSEPGLAHWQPGARQYLIQYFNHG